MSVRYSDWLFHSNVNINLNCCSKTWTNTQRCARPVFFWPSFLVTSCPCVYPSSVPTEWKDGFSKDRVRTKCYWTSPHPHIYHSTVLIIGTLIHIWKINHNCVEFEDLTAVSTKMDCGRSSPWRWRQQAHLQYRSTSTRPNGATTHKTAAFKQQHGGRAKSMFSI
jgi:hypothetical protein